MKKRKGPAPRPPIERFELKVVRPDDPDGCWQWVGSTKATGYGSFSGGRTDGHANVVYAHRWSYEYFVGPIPQGLQIDHLCRNRSCVNPAHMEPVTIGENLRRGFGASGLNFRKTHCPQGHEYTPENSIKTGSGKRCRICHNLRRRRTPVSVP